MVLHVLKEFLMYSEYLMTPLYSDKDDLIAKVASLERGKNDLLQQLAVEKEKVKLYYSSLTLLILYQFLVCRKFHSKKWPKRYIALVTVNALNSEMTFTRAKIPLYSGLGSHYL